MLQKLVPFKNKVTADEMTRHGSIMVAFILLAQFFNYLYQLSMGILLTPVQYGTLFSLTSLAAIIVIFSQAIQISITKFTSKFRVENKLGRVNYLCRFSLKRTFILGSLLFLALAILSPLLSRFFNVESNWYIVILFSFLMLAFTLPVGWGVLRGFQKFPHLGFNQAFWAFCRAAIGILLVYAGLGIGGGLAAVPLSYLVAFIVTLLMVKGLVGQENEKFEVRGLFSYTGLAFLAIACFAILTNIDVVLIKHYLSPENAGNYSAISVLGRIALYAPMGVTIAMFPKTSELFETGQESRPMLLKAALFTLVLGGGVVIIYWLFPEFIANLLFGSKYLFTAPHLFKYALAMFLFAVSFLMINYFLSLNRTKVAYPVFGVMLLELTLIGFFHSSIGQVINIMVISGGACIAVILPFFVKMRGFAYESNLQQ